MGDGGQNAWTCAKKIQTRDLPPSVGPTGLISLLRKNGYKVEQIEWPAINADR